MNLKGKLRFLGQFLVVLLISVSFLLVPTNAAKILMTPDSYTFTVGEGCSQSVGVDLDVTGQDSNAGDAAILFNPNEVTINSVTSGGAYEIFSLYGIDQTAGIIKFYGFTTNKNNTVKSKKRFANISFTPKAGVASTSFKISFTAVGNTYDSNVADTATSNDLLTSVQNSTVYFQGGLCVTQAPGITYLKPLPNSRNNEIDTQVQVQITNRFDIDLATVKFTIDGKDYTALDDSAVTYTGDVHKYIFTIQPREKFAYDYDVKAYTEARNNYNTLGSGSMVFSTKYVCPDQPITNTSSSSSSTTINNSSSSVINNSSSTINSSTINNSTTNSSVTNNPINNSVNNIIQRVTGNAESKLPENILFLPTLLWLLLILLLLLTELFRRTIRGQIQTLIAIDSKDKRDLWAKAININTNLLATQKRVMPDGSYLLRLNPGIYQIFLSRDEKATQITDGEYLKKISVPTYQDVLVYLEEKLEYKSINLDNQIDVYDNPREYQFTRVTFSGIQIISIKLGLWLVFALRGLVAGAVVAGIFISVLNFWASADVPNLVMLVCFLAVFVLRYLIPNIVSLTIFFKQKFKTEPQIKTQNPEFKP